jgi:hypothetical protein
VRRVGHATALDFYTVSAQVIPVLFIALAFETHAFGQLDRPPERDALLAGIRLYAFLLIVWGEAQALHVLSSQAPSHGAHSAIVTALVAEAGLLALEPAVAFLRAEAVKASSRYGRYLKAALSALLTAAGLALVALGALIVVQGL